MASLPNSLWQPPFTTPVVYDNASSQWIELPSSATPLPGVVVLTAFGASGSSNQYIGTISLSSPTTLTLTTTSDFQAGQSVFVAGAGAAGANLIAVVSSVGSGGQVLTLATPALTAVTNHVVQHDDSVSLQTAIDAAFNAGGGTIFIPAGFYRLNGPLTDYNSIIKLPFVPNNASGTGIGITLFAMNQPFAGLIGEPVTGAIFQTDVVGVNTDSSMIAAAAWIPNSPTQTSALTVYIEGLTFQTYLNPQISALDLGMCGNTILKNITIDTGSDGNPPQPTHGTFGIRTPQTTTGISANQFDLLYVGGYGVGIRFSEEFRSSWFIVGRCGVGMINEAGNFHQAYAVGQISECPRLLEIASRMALDMNLDLQTSPNSGDWFFTPPGNDIYDPGNFATGLMKYQKVQSGTGNNLLGSFTGFQHCSVMNMGGLGTRFAGDVSTTNLDVHGALTMFDGSSQVTVGIGADNSATAPGFRELQVPNSGGPGERAALWAAGVGIEAPLPGTLATGLVSFWNMSDATNTNAIDSQGTNNLFNVGTVSSIVGHVPPSNLARGFNGVDQYLATNTPTGLDPGNANYTISCWVYLNSKTVDQCFVSMAQGTFVNSYLVNYQQSSDRLLYVIEDTLGSFHVLTLSTFGSPPINTWIFLVSWFDAAGNTMFSQVNNGAIEMLSLGGGIPATSPGFDFTLGSFGAGGSVGQLLNGRIDAVGFWSRILSA